MMESTLGTCGRVSAGVRGKPLSEKQVETARRRIRSSGVVLFLLAVLWCLAFPAPATAAGPFPMVADLLGVSERDPENARKAVESGARVINLSTVKTFYVYWVPRGYSDLEDRRVLVVLHESGGNAYESILALHESVIEKSVALAAVQWERPGAPKTPEATAIPPEILFPAIEDSLGRMGKEYGAHVHRSAWLGLGKAGGACAHYALLDRGRARPYFEWFVSVSGPIPARAAVTRRLTDGSLGSEPLKGQRFYLWCGEQDPRGLCPSIERSGDRLRRWGAAPVIVRRGQRSPESFVRNTKEQEEFRRLWLGLSPDASVP